MVGTKTFKMAERVCPLGNRGSTPVETDECLSAAGRADEGPCYLYRGNLSFLTELLAPNHSRHFAPVYITNIVSFVRDGSDEMTICRFLLLLNFCQIFFLMNIETS